MSEPVVEVPAIDEMTREQLETSYAALFRVLALVVADLPDATVTIPFDRIVSGETYTVVTEQDIRTSAVVIRAKVDKF